jgi:cell division protein FtsZ
MTFDPENLAPPGAKIKVIGVGGGGSNAVNTMIKSKLEGVDFIVCNTDVQALRFSLADTKIQVGKELTRGLGAGADPDIGRDSALEDRHEIHKYLEGADMVFITAGMGGGTGSGGAAVVAQIAREIGALTVAVVTKPFGFEGKRRRKHAEVGIARLRECVDTLITIPNQRLLQVASPGLSMIDAFKMADDVLVNAVKGISDIINIPGTVNVDFADVKTVMSCMGHALMGIGAAMGEGRAVEAAKKAICSPLLEDVDIEGATGILINITAGSDITLMEVNEACSVVQEAAHEDANIIFGAVIDETLGDEIRVTVIATGFPVENAEIDPVEHGRHPNPSIYNRGLHSPGLISTKPVHRPTQGSTLISQQPRRPDPVVAKPGQASVQAPTQQPTVRQHEQMVSRSNAPVQENPIQHQPVPVTPTPIAPRQETFFHQQHREPQIIAAPALAEQPRTPTFEPDFDLGVSPSTEAQDLAAWTISQPTVQDHEVLEEVSTGKPFTQEEDASFQYGSYAQQATSAEESQFDLSDDNNIASESAESTADVLFDSSLEDEVLETEIASESTPDRAGAQKLSAPLESLFNDQLDIFATDIDKRIDEALELAERMKRPANDASNDDLDVPAFLRTGLKDLPLD